MKNITVYSGPMCNFCDAAKRLLVRNNLEYTEIDISTKEGLREEVAALVIAGAEQILNKEVDESSNKDIVDALIKEL